MKSECGNGLTWFFGVAASHKQCHFLMLMRLLTRTMKESDGNRNELMTTIMRTKRTKTMMRMVGIMRMMRMLRMRMKMQMRMVIMMSRAVVGLQSLSAIFDFCLGPRRQQSQASNCAACKIHKLELALYMATLQVVRARRG